ncbi:MAG: hypothetical protein NVSMB49_25380 [Ktedonobacteraceae bacterium]
MKARTRLVTPLSICVCCLFLLCFTACGGSNGTTSSSTAAVAAGTNTTSSGRGAAVDATPTAAARLGVQPCPAAVSEPSHWDPIVGTESGVNAVTSVTCADLTSNDSLQALVVSVYEGTGQNADIYVFNKITSPNPTLIFNRHNLYKGSARISVYNTLLTAEVDAGSSLNAGQSNAGYQQDLFREFKWSDGAGTLVPVSFPGIFPNLTRYEAERDQQLVNQGKLPFLSATEVASKLATKLLNWSANALTTIVSGGKQHDNDAVVTVKSTGAGAGTLKVTMSRLEGNTNNGIWEVTSVTTDGLSITSPQNRDLLTGTTTVTGTGNAFEGVIGKVKVLDHLYTSIGTADAKGTSGNGNTTFSTNVSYNASFKGGAQEGLLVLYSYSNADGTIAGAVILKELLNA